MANEALHAAIRAKFGMRQSVKNLPWGSGRGYTRYTLVELLAEQGFNVGAEVGVRRGKFSESLCQANPRLHLWCIDPWGPYSAKYTQARQDRICAEAMARVAPYNITVLRKSSMDALADIADCSLDFVFIDGDHSFDHAVVDIIRWSHKVRRGGLVIVHDYYAWGEAGVVHAVNAYTFCHDIRPWYVTKELEPTAYWVNP
jgi:hypothetical protein